jgi:asparagine N-glycosylation enzyme membrane subunit Stt3
MIEFHLWAALLSYLVFAVPGVFLAASLRLNLKLWETLLLGLALGLVFTGGIASVLFFVPFAVRWWLSVVVAYVLGALVFWRYGQRTFDVGVSVGGGVVLIVVLLSLWLRVSTLSPIYQELDPYFYAYAPWQILTHGHMLKVDWTAWYPEVPSGHGVVFLLSYLQASLFKLYSSLTHTVLDPYTFSYFYQFYPAFTSAFIPFFVYLALRNGRDEEQWMAVLFAFILSFLPLFFLKTVAGEAEIQPFGFFALTFFLTSLVRWFFDKGHWHVVAALAFFALFAGSGSGIVGAFILFVYSLITTLYRFLRGEDEGSVLKLTLVVFGAALLVFVLSTVYYSYLYYLPLLLSFAALILPVVASYAAHLPLNNKLVLLGGAVGVIFASFILPFSPLAQNFRGIVSAAEFPSPLSRTIAEQSLSPETLSFHLGVWAYPYPSFLQPYDLFTALLNVGVQALGAVFSVLWHAAFDYVPKAGSLLGVVLFLDTAVFAFTAYRIFIHQQRLNALSFLYPALMLVVFLGLIKVKYLVYAAWALTLLTGFAVRELVKMFPSYNTYVVGAVALLALMNFFSSPAWSILPVSFMPRFADAPEMVAPHLAQFCNASLPFSSLLCEASKQPLNFTKDVNTQFDTRLCLFSLLNDVPKSSEALKGAMYRCQRIEPFWIETMEWLRHNTSKDSRVMSWWDYGHWINYFGQRNAVIRNEHLSESMIMRVAYDYLFATPQQLREDMRYFNATHVLFDVQILMSGKGFGGKFHALNYLACAYKNETDVFHKPGTSACEVNNLWESVFVPKDAPPCKVDDTTVGKTAYAVRYKMVGGQWTGQYDLTPAYCFATAVLADNRTVNALYELNNRDEFGALKLHKAFLIPVVNNDQGVLYELLYTHEKVWKENGRVVDGFSDHVSHFYDTNLYQAFVLEQLPGFKEVFKTQDGNVKVFTPYP